MHMGGSDGGGGRFEATSFLYNFRWMTFLMLMFMELMDARYSMVFTSVAKSEGGRGRDMRRWMRESMPARRWL